MLDIETKYGCFGKFKDVYLFMQEEHLENIEINELRYCLSEIYGKGFYTLDQIQKILK